MPNDIASFIFYTAASLLFLKIHLPYLLGKESKQEFLTKYAWHYKEFSWLNKNVKKGELIYVEPRATYYLKKNYVKAKAENSAVDRKKILKNKKYKYFLLRKKIENKPENIKLVKVFDSKLIIRKIFGRYKHVKTYLYTSKQ